MIQSQPLKTSNNLSLFYYCDWALLDNQPKSIDYELVCSVPMYLMGVSCVIFLIHPFWWRLSWLAISFGAVMQTDLEVAYGCGQTIRTQYPSSRTVEARDTYGLIINLRGSDSPFHIFTNKLNLKLCQDPRALVFHLPTLLIKEAGRPPPNIGGITGVSSFCFHQLASNIISPIYDWFIYNWCRSVLIPGSVPRNKDLNARIRLSTTS